MKSHKTMFDLARVYVMEKGPRSAPGHLFGLYLTGTEIRILYAEQKFNPRNSTVPKHIELWEYCDWVKIEGDIEDPDHGDNCRIWFEVPRESLTVTMVAAEKAGFSGDRVVVSPADLDTMIRW